MSAKKEEQKQHSRSSNTTNPEETKKEVEKLTEDAEKRTTIAKKLEIIVQEREGKNAVMVNGLDESKDNIRQAIKETIAEIPRFTQIVKDFQETAIDISDSFIESQGRIISSAINTK